MARKIDPGFAPNMDDCKMIVKCENGATCYIMDTCCKSFSAEDKKRVDAEIVHIFIASELRKKRSRNSGIV